MYVRKIEFHEETKALLIEEVAPLLMKELVDRFSIKTCVLQLGGGAADVSIADLSSRRGEPSARDLLRVAKHQSIERFLELLQTREAPEAGGVLLRHSLYFRVKRKPGTRLHRDRTFYAPKLRPPESPENSCCFCGGPARTEACQRCAGAGLRTIWIPLHDVDPAKHSTLSFPGGVTATLAFGQAWWFDGNTEHCATEGCSATRFSLDVRFAFDALPKLRVAPSAVEPVQAALQLLENNKRLQAHNYAYLFSFLDVEEGVFTPELLKQMDERWLRRRRSRAFEHKDEEEEEEEEGKNQPPHWHFATIERAMSDWVTGPRPPHDVLVGFLAHVESRCMREGPLRITKRGGHVHVHDAARAFMVTHAVFMATDHLLRPTRWAACASRVVEEWLLDAAERLDPTKNLEIWLEVVLCCSTLLPCYGDVELPMWSLELEAALVPAVAMRYRRSKDDVRLHVRWLLAWASSLQRQKLMSSGQNS